MEFHIKSAVDYESLNCERLNRQKKELFKEYYDTSKFRFIKRKALLIAYNKLDDLWYKNLLLVEKMMSAEYKEMDSEQS